MKGEALARYSLDAAKLEARLRADLAAARAREQHAMETFALVAERFDELLNAQWVEGYSAAEVERLAEFRETVLMPARAALAAEPAADEARA